MKQPVINDDQVLIQVEYFGLNFADVSARKGNYQDAPPFPFVPGYEVSGIFALFTNSDLQVKLPRWVAT
jgi:NADPH2:quinone reductase